MAELKTKVNSASVAKFLESVKDKERREDAKRVLKLMQEITKEKPRMWGTSIVGFGMYHYKYASGQEGNWMLTGFSPRKQNLTVYIMPGFGEYKALLKQLGPHTTSKSCLYIKHLDDIDPAALKKIVAKSFQYMKKKYGR